MTARFCGFPWIEAKEILEEEKIFYRVEFTRPPRRAVFNIEDKNPYVVRERKEADGSLLITLAQTIKQNGGE